MLGCRCMRESRSAAKINRCHAFSFMPEFATDSEPRLRVLDFLCRCQRVGSGPIGSRTWPARQILVTLLGIGVAQTMQLRKSGPGSVPLIHSQLLNIVPVSWN